MGVYLRGKTWYIDYYYKGKRLREAVGPNKKTAQKALEIRKAEITQGKFNFAPIKHKVLFSDFAEEFIAWAYEHRKRTGARRYESSLNELLKFFGDKSLSQSSRFILKSIRKRDGSMCPALP